MSGDHDDEDAVEPAERVMRWFRDTTASLDQWGTEFWQRISPTLDRLLGDPRILAAIEAPRVTATGRLQKCHCLCQAVHPSQPGICQEDSAVTTRRFLDVDVPLCSPCAEARTASTP